MTPANTRRQTEPPHSNEAERGFLSCCFQRPGEVAKEAAKLDPEIFHDLRHRTIFEHIKKSFRAGIVVDLISIQESLKKSHLLKDIGGIGYLNEVEDAAPSAGAWEYYLEIMREKFTLRTTLALCSNITGRIQNHEGDLPALMLAIRAEMETISAAGLRNREPMLDIISPAQAREYQANDEDFLLGSGLIMRGQVITIGGQPGVGKSRLATSLAVAGALGTDRWQNYPVRSQWRSLILQTENTGNRLKEEFETIPPELDDYIRISRTLPAGLAFGSAQFREELAAYYDRWPFEMLILDPLNDIVSEDGQADYKEALANIRLAFNGRPMPSIVIVAHMRKPRAESGRSRKSGRELLHELSGTLAIGSTARTVFVVQAGSSSMDDDRIVFEIAKANDCKPEWLREYGTRSAWHRKNGAFESCQDFDWHGWDNPGDEERRAVTLEMIKECFIDGEELKAAQIARKIAERHDLGESTVHRAISEGGYFRHVLQRMPNSKFTLSKKAR